MNTITVKIDTLKLDWYIGIFDFEYEKAQPVAIDIEMIVKAPTFDGNEDYDDVVCYKTVVDKIKELNKGEHIRLVETLANKVCDICLADNRVETVTVNVKKTAIIDECASVGVELTKQQQ
ncbi:MAG: dihydroneopterin aldolase [Alphaproteobacteria bacterium]